jgi:hypothetical protein
VKGNETPDQAAEIMRLFFDDMRTIYKGDTALTTLWDSTVAFHERFDTLSEPGFDDAQLRVLFEEFYEFVDAMHKGNSELLELTDFIVVAIGLLVRRGYELGQLQMAMIKVAEKNDAKTLATHAKDAKGKVARKTA